MLNSSGRASRKKITVIGAGNVGATTAQRLAERGYADLVLIDVVEGLAEGKALDMQEANPILGLDTQIVGGTSYEPTNASDVVVVTSGVARKPGMSRDDLLLTNQKIVQSVVEQAVRYSPDCVLVVLTNPLDPMTQLAHRVSGFPKARVVGQAGILDTARYRAFISAALGVSPRDIQAYVLGGHGDLMVPLPRHTLVGGRPLTELLPDQQIEEIVERTRKGGEEIVKFLKTGSAFYAPSAALAEMVDAIALDQKRILPCSTLLEGEYGIDGLFVGVPVKLGAGGVEEVADLKLAEDELAALQRSADAVRSSMAVMKL
jgi:malate dehydrogenase